MNIILEAFRFFEKGFPFLRIFGSQCSWSKRCKELKILGFEGHDGDRDPRALDGTGLTPSVLRVMGVDP